MDYVADTSVIIERAVSKFVKEGKIQGKVYIPRAVLAELENQANTGRDTGLVGLEEIQELQGLAKQGKIEVILLGDRPNVYQMKYAKQGGEIDSYIRDLAYNQGATLITADRVQAESARAVNVEVLFIQIQVKEKIVLESFFDDKTMSVHLKEGVRPCAKKGRPGQWDLVFLEDKPLDTDRLQKIAKEIVEKARVDSKSFIEISRRNSTIVQYRNYRIVIVRPPVSDGWEVTAVRPIVQLDISYYKLPETILHRLEERSSGIVVAGEVGSGKSTFAAALAEYYVTLGRITKTIESPRDLVLSDSITQYSKNLGTGEEIHDILFLSRPDAVIFDEMRDSPDFKLYTDIRLGGSAVVGVLHAATPIDTIQRFIGRMDVGMIPSVLDTVIFIENGQMSRVFTLKMVVKVPSGMMEADLARPVIEVRDLSNNSLMFEIYSYGEETVVIPIAKEDKPAVHALAEKQIEREILKYVDSAEVELVSGNKVRVYVPRQDKARLIGMKGARISEIEKRLGVSIDVESVEETREELKRLPYHMSERGNVYLFQIDASGKRVDFFLNDAFLFTSTSSKKGEMKISKKSEIGRKIAHAIHTGEKIIIKG